MQKARRQPFRSRSSGQPPTACRQMVSGSFDSPSGVLFTFPSRYLCTIGRQRVFSLGRWSSQIPTGFHVSRGTRESSPRSQHVFAYGTVTLFGRTFQTVQLTCWFMTPRLVCTRIRDDPTTPLTQRVQALTCQRFRLFPFRSPLLRKSRFLSLPGGT